MFLQFIALVLVTGINTVSAVSSTTRKIEVTETEIKNVTATSHSTPDVVTIAPSPSKKLLSPIKTDTFYHKIRKDREIKEHLGEFKMIRRKTHFTMPPFDFDLNKILEKYAKNNTTKGEQMNLDSVDTVNVNITKYKVNHNNKDCTVNTEDNLNIDENIINSDEDNKSVNIKQVTDEVGEVKKQKKRESALESPLYFKLHNEVHGRNIKRNIRTEENEKYDNKMKELLNSEDYHIGSELYRRALKYPSMFSNLQKQTLLMEKLLDTLDKENLLRQQPETTKLNEFMVIVNMTHEDNQKSDPNNTNKGKSDHVISPKDLLYAVDDGTTTTSTKTTAQMSKDQDMPTVMSMIDEVEVRNALLQNPFVQRILRLSSVKRKRYLKRVEEENKTV